MRKFHVYHISFFDSILQGLHNAGANLDKITQGCHIKRFDLENPDTYIPLEVSYEFFDKLSRSQSIDNLSSEFYARFKIEDLSEYGQFLPNCPDLYSILQFSILYDYLIQTSGSLHLDIQGGISWFSMKHLDTPSTGRHISEQINFAMMMKLFQSVLGADWVPIDVHITSPGGHWLYKHLGSIDFNLKTNCSGIAISFKTSLLAEKNPYYNLNAIDLNAENQETQSLEDITHKIFNSMSNHYLPTLDEFSEYFGVSKRTLMRSYAQSGISFKELIEKHLFLRALKLLDERKLSIEEISMLLGYSHASNFIKAFKRWTATTPSQYQQQMFEMR